MSITEITPVITNDTEVEQEEPKVAHIVRKEDQMRGYIEGAPIEALCGKVWVPSRDPNNLPLCEGCKDVMEKLSVSHKGLN